MHDCGHLKDSWQCKGSHLPTSEKVPPSLREPVKQPAPRNVTRETLPVQTSTKRPLREWVAELSESKKAAK